MGHLCHLRSFALAALASLISCSNASMMDATDDEMVGPMSPAEVDAACSACFERDCAWEATECAADPQCATWLTCVRAKGVEGGCANPEGRTAGGLQSALASCLSGCCPEGKQEPDVTAPGSAGATGGSNYGGAAGAQDELGPTGGSAGGSTGGWQCPTTQCSCSDCIDGLGANDQGSACAYALEQCKQSKCGKVVTEYDTCQTQSATAEGGVSQRALESCLFQEFRVNANTDADYHDGIKQFMESMIPCMINECASYCLPADAQACLVCQEKSCGDEMALFRSDSNAILNVWCRSYCQLNQDEGCPGMCSVYLQADDSTPNQDTVEALGAYGECSLRCPDC